MTSVSPRREGLRTIARKRTHTAFTLVEILVVVLILSILMAVALPLYLSAIQSSSRQTARANLQTIINAEQAHRLSKQKYEPLPSLIGEGQEFNQNIVGPGQTQYHVYLGGETMPNGCVVPAGGVAACANDSTRGADGDYGCLIPGQTDDTSVGCTDGSPSGK